MDAAWRNSAQRSHDKRQRLHHQRVASAPKMQRIAIGSCDRTHRAKTKSFLSKFGLQPEALPPSMKAQIPHIGIGRIIPTLTAEPNVGVVQRGYDESESTRLMGTDRTSGSIHHHRRS